MDLFPEWKKVCKNHLLLQFLILTQHARLFDFNKKVLIIPIFFNIEKK